MAAPILISGAEPVVRKAEWALASAARPWATTLVLLTADALALSAAGWLGYFLWSRVNPSIGVQFFYQLAPALAVSLIIYACSGLYPAAGISPVEEFRRLSMGTTAVCLVSIAAVFFSKEAELYSRGVFLTSWLAAVIAVPVCRAWVRAAFSRRGWWGVPVLVMGSGPEGRRLAAGLCSNPKCGLKPVAYLSDDLAPPCPVEGIPLAGPLRQAEELGRRLRIRQAIVAMPGAGRERLLELVERLGPSFSRLIIVPDMFGLATLWITPKDLSGVLGLEVRQNLLMPVNRLIKRAMDVVFGGILGVLSLPLIVVAVVWIKRASPGPAFFVQHREGHHGARLPVRKLRTMHPNSEALLLEYLRQDAGARSQWQRSFKLKNDPRIIPFIGAFLRRSSLDELPQLWSVLKGEMSLVGPRPFPYYHLEHFDPSFRALRRRVPPGLTGLWQVETRSDGDLAVQQSMDTYYIRNWSVWLDLYILARTVYAVLSGKGAC